MSEKIETYIPFSGFYESFHDALLEGELIAMFSDEQAEPDFEVIETARGACDWGHVRLDYAKAYVNSFADQFGLKTLEFNELVSPREYNFTTDRILCTMDRAEFREVCRRVDPATLDKVCADNLTSGPGFVSFYNPNWREWTGGFDANQRHMIMSALADCQPFDDFDRCAMESYSCNGRLTQWIETAIPEVGKLYDLANENRKRIA